VANEDKATRYHRLRRRASLLSTAGGALFLFLFLITGASIALRDLAASRAGDSLLITVAIYVAGLMLMAEAVHLPFAFYLGVTLERRYGLSTEPTARWWLDEGKAFAIAIVFSTAGATFVYALLRWDPQRWWIAAAAGFAAILIVLAQLTPVLLLPLFYEFKPLDNVALRDRLISLAERAGARVLGVFEWRISDRTRKANAALTGIGRTRRILLSDTLLAEHSDDEIEVILAHELAHHVYRDIWSGIAFETALVTLAFFLADRMLAASIAALGLSGKADVAGLPVLVLTAGALSLMVKPLANAFSRAHERRADRYALEMTHNVPAFVAAMKRLGAQNLAEEQPSRLVEVLFCTHPPVSARVRAAQEWLESRQRARTTS
jgi:STE24 endopeptidase